MNIDRVTALPLRAATDYAEMTLFVVRVQTSDGVVGWGESCDCFGVSYPTVLQRIVEDVWAPAIVGAPAASVLDRLEDARRAVARTLGFTFAVAQSYSAVEIAVRDALGRAAGASAALSAPLRDRVSVYAGNSHFLESRPAGDHLDLLSPLLERGVRMVKMRIGADWRRALAVLTDLSDLLPAHVDIMVDASELYSVAESLEMAPRLADLRVGWFEEPVPSSRSAAIARIADASPVPIAYGEHLFSADQALDALESAAISVIQPDASICGGMAAARRMGEVAQGRGARVVMHLHGSPITIAANALVASGLPGVDVIEYPFHLSPMLERIAPGCGFDIPSIVDGTVAVPTGPGLGVDVDADAIDAAHRAFLDA